MTRWDISTSKGVSEIGTANFILKRPSVKEGRKSWSLLKRTKLTNGRYRCEAVESEILNSLNDLYLKGVQDFDQLDKQAVALRTRLNREEKGKPGSDVFNQANFNILGDYQNPAPGSFWHDVYGRRKKLIDRFTSYCDFRRAVEAVGNLSLVTASASEIEAELERRKFSDTKQRRIASRLTSLLKFIGRKDVEIEKALEEVIEVKHLTIAQFETLLFHVKGRALRALAGMAFHSGLRKGELFAVKPEDVSENVVRVNLQLDRAGKLRPTKTRSKRKAYLLAGGKKYFDEWFALPIEERLALRTINLARLITAACVLNFPKSPDCWLVFHDLRHSYAIALLSRRVPLSFVARSLGNSEAVCEKHYTGKVLTDEIVEAIDSIVSRKL